MGSTPGSLCLVSSRLGASHLFLIFTLYLFTVITHSHEYHCMLSPVSSPRVSITNKRQERLQTQHSSLFLIHVKISANAAGGGIAFLLSY